MVGRIKMPKIYINILYVNIVFGQLLNFAVIGRLITVRNDSKIG